MANYIVSTDSGSDLSRSLYEKYDIKVIKMEYEIDGVYYEDKIDHDSLKDFYDKMRGGAVPKTTQINTSRLEEYFESLLPENKNILHISLGSGISGTAHNAQEAAKAVMSRHPDAKITAIDGKGACLVHGLLAVLASENREKGMSLDENAEYINSIKTHVNTYYTTRDLTYLQRGGRVSKTGAIVAHMLGINPILKLDHEGHLLVCDKVRGEKATFDRVEKLIADTVENPGEQRLFISNADCYEKAEMLGKRFKEKFGFADIVITDIGPIIGAHTGPGLVAFFYIGKDRV